MTEQFHNYIKAIGIVLALLALLSDYRRKRLGRAVFNASVLTAFAFLTIMSFLLSGFFGSASPYEISSEALRRFETGVNGIWTLGAAAYIIVYSISQIVLAVIFAIAIFTFGEILFKKKFRNSQTLTVTHICGAHLTFFYCGKLYLRFQRQLK